MAKYIQTKQIGVTELCVGMYVARLQVPWSATPFPLQGVMVESKEDIVELAKYGNTLYIDESKCLSQNHSSLLSHLSSQTGRFISTDIVRKRNRYWKKFCTRSYMTDAKLGKEMFKAYKVFERVGGVFQMIRRDPKLQRVRSYREVESVSKAIVDSVLGHPDALIWIAKVKSCGGPVYDHTLRAAVWATIMGRSMGLLKSALHQLNEAILLSGVGKMGLKKADWQCCDNLQIDKRFARWSKIALKRLAHSRIEPKVLRIIGNMTERQDGTGFPEQKAGMAIPYLSQIAAIAEAFDLTMNPPGKKTRRSVGQALCRLYWCRDTLFDGQLVEELIQAIGLYPAGSLVELSSGEKGVVIEQSRERRIRATVALTHDEEGLPVASAKVVKLGNEDYDEVIILQEAEGEVLRKVQLRKVDCAIMSFHFGILYGLYYRFRQLFNA